MPVTHGMSGTPIYRLWWGMISRCSHPKTRGYPSYGGAGVQVCQHWRRFENFYADMGDRPTGMTLERRDNSRGYEPGNVVWAPNAEQQRHRRDNVLVDWGGKTYVLADLCRELGIHATHLYRNMKRGMTLAGAIEHLVELKEKRNGQIV